MLWDSLYYCRAEFWGYKGHLEVLVRKMTNERHHQQPEALWSSTMCLLARMAARGCPLLPPISFACHQGELPQATSKLIIQGKGKQYTNGQWLRK